MSRKSKRQRGGKRPAAKPAVLDRQAAESAQNGWQVFFICAALIVLVFTVFGQTIGHDFVNFDDGLYVYDNPVVSRGLTLAGIGWAFTHVVSANWHPLTVIIHMLDCQLYGLWAGGHHLTNVILHAACVVLLFLLLLEMTGVLWRSGFVAAIFAIHPLRVESVAWVSELKDVLSGVFFMLTLWAYVRYVRSPQTRGRYIMVMVWLALGLMSKPMLVTVPFVLVLLDYWPLRRLQHASQLPTSLWEKIPLFALSTLSCVSTVLAQTEAIALNAHLSLSARFCDALIAYAAYLKKLIYPSQLAVLYPVLKQGWPAWQVIGALALLLALTVGAYKLRQRQPFLLVGWLWYLGMLVPVIGLLQVGSQAYADRYTYLPQIGLCIAATWAAGDWAGELPQRRWALGGIACAILCGLTAAAYHQTTWWRDSTTLWTHTLECTQDNSIAHNDLGDVLLQQGQTQDAIGHFNEALRINPAYAEAHVNLGNALFQQGHTQDAIAQYRTALQINPAAAEAHNNLGLALLQQGRPDEALDEFRAALQINPASAEIHANLGIALFQLGRADEAINEFRAAVQINPAYAEAHRNLAVALFQLGKADEAIPHSEKALALQPSSFSFQDSLAWMPATAPQAPLRNGPRALELASSANQATGGRNARVLHTLAAAYAATGDFANAVQTAQKALRLAEAQSNTPLVTALRREITLYKAGTTVNRN